MLRYAAECDGGQGLSERFPWDISSTASATLNYAFQVAEDPSKNHRRRTWLVACIGVILGFAVACIEGPTLVSLAFKPLVESLSCAAPVDQALTRFVELQFGCALLGAVLSLVMLFFWRRFFRRRAEAKSGIAS